jgi:hypothetical protein
LIDRLEDDEAKVRWLAILALSDRTTNATPALPALRLAYANESTRPSFRGDLGDGIFAGKMWSPQDIRSAIRDAIKAIDPNAPLLVDPP